MNYKKISDTLGRHDPLLSRHSLKINSTSDIKAGLEYLIKAMRLPPPEISDEAQTEAAFIDLITTHFLSDEQCRVIGRIPVKLSYQHLGATFMNIYHNAHPAWRYQSQIISSIQKLFSCSEALYLKMLDKIYREICFYVSACDRCYDIKEIKQFLAATISILWYYVSILEKGGCKRMWNYIHKRNVRRSNHNKLQSLLQYAADLIETNWNDTSAVFTLIKILTDKMVLDGVMNLLTTNRNSISPEYNSFFMQINPKLDPKYNIGREVYQAFIKNQKEVTVMIDLAKDPILTFPWEHERFVKCMSNIGSPNKPWIEHTLNHFTTLYLPIGVTFVNNGFHSTFTGMAKREGTLNIFPDSGHTAVDISSLYHVLQFDGTNYLIAGSDVVAGTASSFEFGCIFEIGRMLHERGICFKNLNT